MAHTAVNFTAQRVSFVNKIGTILKATSDNEEPTQAFLYKEIIGISYESVGYSESLVEFLIDRLRNKSCHVKFKVLKVIKHLCEHGSSNVKLGLRKAIEPIKECTKFGGPPHPIHGNMPYTAVRKLANDVCEFLFNMDPLKVEASQDTQLTQDPKYGGLGSYRSGATSQGFGNTPAQPKGIGETILEGIEKIGAKLNETAKDRQAALLATLDLSSSTSNYRPPLVPSSDPITASHYHTDVSADLKPPSPVKVTHHKPGKAGGGWNDDDDDDDDEDDNNENNHSRPYDGAIRTMHQPPMPEEPDWSQELHLVSESVCRGSTGSGLAYLAPSALASFLLSCSRLKCDKVVELIANNLTQRDVGLVIRSLQLLEALIYSKEELLSTFVIASMCKDQLLDCYKCFSEGTSCISESEHQQLEPNDQCIQGVKMKVLKIILILQKLEPNCDILPQEVKPFV